MACTLVGNGSSEGQDKRRINHFQGLPLQPRSQVRICRYGTLHIHVYRIWAQRCICVNYRICLWKWYSVYKKSSKTQQLWEAALAQAAPSERITGTFTMTPGIHPTGENTIQAIDLYYFFSLSRIFSGNTVQPIISKVFLSFVYLFSILRLFFQNILKSWKVCVKVKVTLFYDMSNSYRVLSWF